MANEEKFEHCQVELRESEWHLSTQTDAAGALLLQYGSGEAFAEVREVEDGPASLWLTHQVAGSPSHWFPLLATPLDRPGILVRRGRTPGVDGFMEVHELRDGRHRVSAIWRVGACWWSLVGLTSVQSTPVADLWEQLFVQALSPSPVSEP